MRRLRRQRHAQGLRRNGADGAQLHSRGAHAQRSGEARRRDRDAGAVRVPQAARSAPLQRGDLARIEGDRGEEPRLGRCLRLRARHRAGEVGGGGDVIWSRIVGTGSGLPAKIVTNDDLAKRMDTSDEWIRTRTGIRQRHIAEPSQTSSDLGVDAGRAALAAARISPQEIDLIIVATATPDYIFPSTACIMQAKLGIKGCTAFDVQAVCSGFVYALAIADKFIRSGQHRCALVVGTDVYSRILDWNDRGTAVLFGDGAGAVVLKADS